MPEYEVLYFPVSGRAAVARMLFKLADVKFTDTRYTGAEWQTVKQDRKRFPLGQMPVLRVDDTYIAESGAIFEYLAQELGFHGTTNLEKAYVTMLTQAMSNVFGLLAKFFFERDQELAAKLKETFLTEQLPKSLTYLEDLLAKRENGEKFFLGDKMTLADVVFLDLFLTLVIVSPNVLDKTPKLKGLFDRLKSMPKMAEYIPTRTYTL